MQQSRWQRGPVKIETSFFCRHGAGRGRRGLIVAVCAGLSRTNSNTDGHRCLRAASAFGKHVII